MIRQFSLFVAAAMLSCATAVPARAIPISIAEFLVPETSGAATANTGSQGPAAASLSSGVTFQTSEPNNGERHSTGHSLLFDGDASSRATAGVFPSLQSNYQKLTAMAWVNIPDFDGASLRHVLHATSGTSGIPSGFALAVLSNGQLGFTHRRSDGAVLSPVSSTATTVATGDWTHIAVTVDYDAGELKFYINGEQVGGTTALVEDQAILGDSSTDLTLGRKAGSGANMMKGGLDDVRVFMDVLNQGEIQQQMMAVPEPGSLKLMGLGGVALMWRRRRNQPRRTCS